MQISWYKNLIQTKIEMALSVDMSAKDQLSIVYAKKVIRRILVYVLVNVIKSVSLMNI